MKIQFLGTAAAECMPGLFCTCDNCKRARALGGKNRRSRTQTAINGRLLIDYPCDTFYHMELNGLNILDFEACIVTHTHSDHLYPKDFGYTRPGYSIPPENWKGIQVYGSEDITEALDEQLKAAQALYVHTVKPYEPFDAAGCKITALRANHGTPHPYNYIISDGEKTLLYAHDTGYPLEEVWDYFKSTGIHFDLVSLDCTGGLTDEISYDCHMCLGKDEEVRDRLKEIGAADEKTIFVLNHFSHNGVNTVYDDMLPIAEKYGFRVTHDGMTIEF